MNEESYFGEISFIFQLVNQYSYRVVSKEDDSLLYSIRDDEFKDILETYPEFQDVLKIRALRRYHYLTRLRRQYYNITDDDRQSFNIGHLGISTYKLGLKRVKL